MGRRQWWIVGATAMAIGLLGIVARGAEPEVRLTYLYDNTSAADGVKPDWGFACLVEGHGKTVLFDTGTNEEIFRHNVSALKVDLSRVQALVLSHDHRDHTGGLAVLGSRPGLPVFCARGFGEQTVKSLADAGFQATPVTRSAEIFPGYRVSDAMPLEGEPGGRVIEEALLVDTRDGLVVIVGCAHPGIVPMIRRIRETSTRPVVMVLGGFHLLETPADEVRSVIAGLKSMGVAYAGPTHCTGEEAIRLFSEAYGDHFIRGGAGTIVEIPPAGGRAPLTASPRPQRGPAGDVFRTEEREFR